MVVIDSADNSCHCVVKNTRRYEKIRKDTKKFDRLNTPVWMDLKSLKRPHHLTLNICLKLSTFK